jgi:2-polyprenyl-6-methoxyphenol hydroxylase-like FAD-dependent oxidoreductase
VNTDYDIVTVGGGLGGLALAKAMSERGHRVLVLERSGEFKDRVRGEVLVPWGCLEARRLGLYEMLEAACGHHVRYWATDLWGQAAFVRDLVETLPTAVPVLTFFHPEMQATVLAAAVAAGAHVLRSAVVREVVAGECARIRYERDGDQRDVTARLVVGADGRGSAVRKWGGFEVTRAKPRRFFAGVLVDGVRAREDTMHARFAPDQGLMNWIFPQGNGRVRTYIGYHAASSFERLQGEKDWPRFRQTAEALGVPADVFAKARLAGPLATFEADDEWVAHPHRDGVVLIGDAASTSDPTWGQGMSHTLFDVRSLSEALCRSEDWRAAADEYAVEHERAAHALRTADGWYTDLLLDIGPTADAARAKALPRILEDPSRIPDTPLAGPDVGADEAMRARMFALGAA